MKNFFGSLLRNQLPELALILLGGLWLFIGKQAGNAGYVTFAASAFLLLWLGTWQVLAQALPFLTVAVEKPLVGPRPILLAKALVVLSGLAGITVLDGSMALAGLMVLLSIGAALLLALRAQRISAVLRGQVSAEPGWFGDRLPEGTATVAIYTATSGTKASRQLLSVAKRLTSLGIRPVLIVRLPGAFIPLARKYDGPVWFAPTIAFLDMAMLPSIKTVLYTRNVPLNGHAIRFNAARHILVVVSDDYDEATCLDNTHALYDRILIEDAALAERTLPTTRKDMVELVQVVEDCAKAVKEALQ